MIAKSVKAYFSDIKNINLINELKDLGLNFKYISTSVNDKLEGQTFVQANINKIYENILP